MVIHADSDLSTPKAWGLELEFDPMIIMDTIFYGVTRKAFSGLLSDIFDFSKIFVRKYEVESLNLKLNNFCHDLKWYSLDTNSNQSNIL